MQLIKRLSTIYQMLFRKHYKTFEMIPIYNFRKVKETKDLRYLLKLKDYEYLPNINTKYLEKVWEDITFQYTDELKKTAKWIEIDDNTKRNAELVFYRFFRVVSIVNYLTICPHSEKWENELYNLGYPINKKKKYNEALEKVIMIAQNDKQRAEVKLEEIKKTSDENSTTIHSTLENIINYTKLGINERVDTYCTLIHRMAVINEDIMRQKLQDNGR